MTHIQSYDVLLKLSTKKLLPTIPWVLLILTLFVTGTFQNAFAQKRKVTPTGFRLMKAPVSVGAVSTLTTLTNNWDASPRNLRVDDANVYWTDPVSVNSTPRSGGSSTVLASGLGPSSDLVIHGGSIFWAEDYCCGGGAFTGNIKTMPITGGTSVTLISGLNGVRSLDVVSGVVYFIEGERHSRLQRRCSYALRHERYLHNSVSLGMFASITRQLS